MLSIRTAEVREAGGKMKRIIIAAAALTLATAVQANPSDPIDAATDSLIKLCKKFALDSRRGLRPPKQDISRKQSLVKHGRLASRRGSARLFFRAFPTGILTPTLKGLELEKNMLSKRGKPRAANRCLSPLD